MALIERVLDRVPRSSLQDHLDAGGGAALDVARRFTPAEIAEELTAAGLRGRGGAGFPTGTKWATVAGAPSPQPPTVVVNAAEGEPHTFKDRALLRANPYKVLEGALVAARAVGATEVVVATKASFTRELALLRSAIDEIRDADWGRGVSVRVVEGPDSYLFGEETALLEVVSGRRPFPRVSPPWRRGVDADEDDDAGAATGSGAADRDLVGAGPDAAPALVNNVETLANVTEILARGASWFREVGTPDSPGTIVCTMTGDCLTTAVGEVPMGTPLRDAIEIIGGGAAHARLVGAMSGVANPIVPEHLLDTPLSHDAMRAIGTGLGAAGFFVIDDRTDIADLVASASRFLAIESCGQCERCKADGLTIASVLAEPDVALDEPTVRSHRTRVLRSRLDTVTDGARCALATQQHDVVTSGLDLYPTELISEPRDTEVVQRVLPLEDIVDGRAVLATDHLTKQPDWTHDEVDSGTYPVDLDVPVTIGDRP